MLHDSLHEEELHPDDWGRRPQVLPGKQKVNLLDWHSPLQHTRHDDEQEEVDRYGETLRRGLS